jgi:hypothetical protein
MSRQPVLSSHRTAFCVARVEVDVASRPLVFETKKGEAGEAPDPGST